MASRSWNRVELIGNLTRDPELRFVPSGTAVATFGLATNRTYVSEGEKKEEVDLNKVVDWGKLAELCSQLIKKGSRVFISGRLQYREWEPQEGGKRRDAEIVLEDLILLTPKSGYGQEVVVEDVHPEETKPRLPDEQAPAKPDAAPEKPDSPPANETEEPEEKNPAKEEKVADDEDLPF